MMYLQNSKKRPSKTKLNNKIVLINKKMEREMYMDCY